MVEVSTILIDCRHYLMTFNFVLLRHVNREANGVANRLAHLARSSVLDELWEDGPRDIIQDVLIEDDYKFSQENPRHSGSNPTSLTPRTGLKVPELASEIFQTAAVTDPRFTTFPCSDRPDFWTTASSSSFSPNSKQK
ncbi:hypothetical protein ACLB2K_016532 [Fragaria x ananassa]